jgi:double-stranded uracil-DNA glycosylase
MTPLLPDILDKGLTVVFCGINPALSAAVAGHHFAGRSNRFWRTIHQAGFTPSEVLAVNDREILQYRCGLTALVERPTARAEEVSTAEFVAATKQFEKKIARYTPRYVAFLGKAAYSALSRQRDISWGRQPTCLAGAIVWVLPNPSGRNRAFSLGELVGAYSQLRRAIEAEGLTSAGARRPQSEGDDGGNEE